MKTPDAIKWVKTAVMAKAGRNILTILGFAIGVSSVTILGAMGDSLRQFVMQEFTQFGSNIIAINPGKTETFGISGILNTNRGLSLEDTVSLRALPEITSTVPVVAGTAEIRYKGKTRATEIYGVSSEGAGVWKLQIMQGHFLPNDDILRSRANVVLGSKLKNALFDDERAIGEYMHIGGSRFMVAGVLAPKGRFMGMDLDEVAYIPAGQALRLFNREFLMEVDIQYHDNFSSEQVAERIKQHMVRRHGAEDFTITTQDQMLESLDSILNVVRIAGLGIGAISLLVGSIGIYTMLTITQSERRNEIGLLRALGMNQVLIIKLFLGEALLLALLGGIVGLILLLLLQIIAFFVMPQLPMLFSIYSISLALVISSVVGLLAGVRPAYLASQLPPFVALRAE
ncbi:ABC transporter permease [Paraneptunicella aestuarii]|uniref:ABC transporter permease n=1 Tax=Paraneptunicella aestuarii TaxID=2831148 RepID=UPI001E3B0B26|nr:ABC transporter permease [Paraneptunicella aestuarii]UAA39043.1 ABC transporter permease [Paraneptunicella aestuarii]